MLRKMKEEGTISAFYVPDVNQPVFPNREWTGEAQPKNFKGWVYIKKA